MTVSFVLDGRLKAVRVDHHGVESLFRMIDRGDQYGMMVGVLAEPVPIRVIALEPTTVLSLDYEQAMELTLRHLDLRRLWLKTYAGLLKRHFLGTTERRAPMMVALFHDSPATRSAAERLLERLRELGENLAVFSDSDSWQGAGRECDSGPSASMAGFWNPKRSASRSPSGRTLRASSSTSMRIWTRTGPCA